jgi:hypothetical protein
MFTEAQRKIQGSEERAWRGGTLIEHSGAAVPGQLVVTTRSSTRTSSPP